jgi:hypothetical protein
MKPLLILITLITTSATAQPNIGMSVQSKGFGLSSGFLAGNLDMQLGLSVSKTTDVARIFYASTGYKIKLDNAEEDNFSITPSVGISKYHITDASQWKSGGEVKEINKILPFASFEIGKDVSALVSGQKIYARMFISANYCEKMFASLGLRAFIK